MSQSDALTHLTAREMLRRLNAGEVTSEALVQAHIDRSDAIDDAINVWAHRFNTQALEQARASDAARDRGETLGPLHGMPISIKESMQTVGVPTTIGIRKRLQQNARQDAVTVSCLREAGAIVLGKSNIIQLLLGHECENPIWGTTSNPWNISRVPGGSSGGEGAAIAAGLSPWGVGTDIGGSIRVPAAFCGVAGLKPTVDRWSNVRSHTAIVGQEVVRGQCGPMARTAGDVALLFRAIDSPVHALKDPRVAPLSTPDPAQVPLQDLRVGMIVDDGYITPAASVQRGLREAGAALEAAGVTVVPMTAVAQDALIDTYFAALSADGTEIATRALAPEPPIDQLKEIWRVAKMPGPIRRAIAALMAGRGEHRVARLLKSLGRKSVAELWGLTARRNAIRWEVSEAWKAAGIDAVIIPPHATPALGHKHGGDFTAAGSYSMRYNFLDFPAGVVATTRVRPDETSRPRGSERLDRKAAVVQAGTAGLPVGVQVAARPYQEHIVLALMMAIEAGCRSAEGFPVTPIDPSP